LRKHYFSSMTSALRITSRMSNEAKNRGKCLAPMAGAPVDHLLHSKVSLPPLPSADADHIGHLIEPPLVANGAFTNTV
jgi:hypothetical protein